MVQDLLLGGKNMNLLFSSNNVNLLLKTSVGEREDLMFFFLECFNCRWEGGKVGKVRKVGGR